MKADPLVLIVTLKGTPHALPRGRNVGRRRPVSMTGPAKVYAAALERAARAVVLNVGADVVQQAFAGHALAVSILWRFPTKFAGRLGTLHSQKPDRDNLEKLAVDALQRAGALGGDDCRVAMGECVKRWALHGSVSIRVEVAPDPPPSRRKQKPLPQMSAPPGWLEGTHG
jgi:Holliday junction resolvase RusA-like endonuclease